MKSMAWPCGSLVWVLAAAAASGAQRLPAAPPDEPLTLSLAAPGRALHPGDVGLVAVTAPSVLTGLEGSAFGRPAYFWPADAPTQWYGLVAVALTTSPGAYDLNLRGATAAGGTASGRVRLQVQAKRFETRRLTVDASLVDPPESQAARIARDAKAMADAFAAVSPVRLWSGPFEVPVPGAATSSFGRLSIMNGRPTGRHQGADFRAPSGTPVRAPNRARVVLAEDLYFAGNTIILDHGLGLFSLLAHLSRIDVQPGRLVARGETVGSSGATGRVTGPHLHWAVRFGEVSVDPSSLVAAVADLPETPAASR